MPLQLFFLYTNPATSDSSLNNNYATSVSLFKTKTATSASLSKPTVTLHTGNMLRRTVSLCLFLRYSTKNCISSIAGWLENHELEGIWKGAALA